MASPLRIEAGFSETQLPTARPVTLRVLRLAVCLTLPYAGGVWAVNTPVLAIDRSTTPPRHHLIIDPALIMTAAGVLMFMLSALSNRGLGDKSQGRPRVAGRFEGERANG